MDMDTVDIMDTMDLVDKWTEKYRSLISPQCPLGPLCPYCPCPLSTLPFSDLLSRVVEAFGKTTLRLESLG
jgi:hypothetical protein